MQYSFDVQEAVEYGLEEAIMIWNLRFWILKNKANNKHQYCGEDGINRAWTYNSNIAYQKLFPFWKKGALERLLNKMLDKKIIIKGNFNFIKHDRTSWYAFYDETKILSPSLIIAHFSESGNGNPEIGKWKSRNREMEIPKSGNVIETDIKPNIKTDINSISEKSDNEEENILFFKTFWKRWQSSEDSNKGSKTEAEKQFNKLVFDKKSLVNPVHIIIGADSYLKNCIKNNIKTCHVSTFLSQKRYEEFLEAEIARIEAQQKDQEASQSNKEKFKTLNDDTFWVEAKAKLINSTKISQNWKANIEKLIYFGTDDKSCHQIGASSKFVRDWLKIEYKAIFDSIFGKWVIIFKE